MTGRTNTWRKESRAVILSDVESLYFSCIISGASYLRKYDKPIKPRKFGCRVMNVRPYAKLYCACANSCIILLGNSVANVDYKNEFQ